MFDSLKFQLLKYKNIFMVYDRNVEKYALSLGNYPSYPIIADEAHKTIETVLSICRWLMEKKADRGALVLAVGGGCTSDIVGFACGIYKRGIRYANVPTTLLAQIDASIGGKTGVNLDGFKNMIGIFQEPEFVHLSSAPFDTLPEDQFLEGAAEMLKTFIIKDRKNNYRNAVAALSIPYDQKLMEPLIKEAIKVKKKIVKRDPHEKGLRRMLNLGHTYAHAIEWCSKGAIPHGKAVAMGIIRAAELSEEKGIAEKGLALRLRKDFEFCGLPTEIPFSEDQLQEALRHDKKHKDGLLNFVYIKRIGKVKI